MSRRHEVYRLDGRHGSVESDPASAATEPHRAHPRDYADGDETDIDEPMPRASRPMFSLVETALLVGLFAIAGVCLWIGFSWGAR